MKLFQQMLVAPAALGLLAPLAVVNSPAANAAELNINGVSDYAAHSLDNSLDQVTSVTQFSDVRKSMAQKKDRTLRNRRVSFDP